MLSFLLPSQKMLQLYKHVFWSIVCLSIWLDGEQLTPQDYHYQNTNVKLAKVHVPLVTCLPTFLGLFCGLPFCGLPCREADVFFGLPRCEL